MTTRLLTGFAALLLMATSVSGAPPATLALEKRAEYDVLFDEPVKSAVPSSAAVQLKGIGERKLVIIGSTAGRAVVEYVLRSGVRGSIAVTVGDGDNQLEAIADLLRRRLESVIGIDIRVNDSLNMVEVTGTVRTFKDRALLDATMDTAGTQWPRMVVNSADEEINTKLLEGHFEEMLTMFNVEEGSAKFSTESSQLVLRGKVYTATEKAACSSTAEKLIDDLDLDGARVINEITVADASVTIQMTFFSYGDSLSKDVGMDLLNNIGLGVAGESASGTDMKPEYNLGINVDLEKIFNFLEDRGYVAITKEVTIQTKNGTTGKSSFGGTLIVPIRGSGDDGSVIGDYDYGNILEATPTLISRDVVELAISGEISAVQGTSKQGYVQIAKSSVSAQPRIQLGRSMVLGVNSVEGTTSGSGGTPFLRRIWPLSLIFGEKTSGSEKFYHGFIVTPRVEEFQAPAIPSVAAKTDDVLRKIRERLKSRGIK